MVIPGENPNTPGSPFEPKPQNLLELLRKQAEKDEGSVPNVSPYVALGIVDLDKIDEVNEFGNLSIKFKGTDNETGEPLNVWMNTKKKPFIYGNTRPDPIDPKLVKGKVWRAVVYGTAYTNPQSNRKKFYFDCLVLDIEGGEVKQPAKPRDFSKNPLLDQ